MSLTPSNEQVSPTTVGHPKFELGRIVATPAALDALTGSGETATPYLSRHVRGDWGEVPPEDKAANDAAIAHEGNPDQQERVLSAYTTKAGDCIWIITEADRSSTCVLLPEDY